MKGLKFTGIVIKRQDLGEADRLITFFTEEHGKLTIKAKGVRRLTSRRLGSLELFNLIQGMAIEGKSGLVLGEVKLIKTHALWKRHLGRVTIAYQLVELVDKLTGENQAHPMLYKMLEDNLLEIAELKEGWAKKLEKWQVEMLVEMGYWTWEKKYPVDVKKLIEQLSDRAYQSPKLMGKLSH